MTNALLAVCAVAFFIDAYYTRKWLKVRTQAVKDMRRQSEDIKAHIARLRAERGE